MACIKLCFFIAKVVESAVTVIALSVCLLGTSTPKPLSVVYINSFRLGVSIGQPHISKSEIV